MRFWRKSKPLEAEVLSYCPFYGKSAIGMRRAPPILALIDTRGNQCALVIDDHAPCYLEMRGETPDWNNCERVTTARIYGILIAEYVDKRE